MTLTDLDAQPLRWTLCHFTLESTERATNREWRAALHWETQPALWLERSVEKNFHGAQALTVVKSSRVPPDDLSAAGQLCLRCGKKLHTRKQREVMVMGYAVHLNCLPALDLAPHVAGDLLLFAQEQVPVRTIAEVWAAEGKR